MDIFKTLIDLAIASFLLYRVIVIIRGTKSTQIALGLLLLLMITYLVRALDLTVTSWLLEQFWLAGILLLVIVFQTEIRQALADLRKNPMIAKFLQTEKLQFLDEVVAAITELAKSKTGASIVLERDTGLRNYCDSGVAVYGQVSRELLLAIFNNGSALRAGAVIISAEGKLLAARCVLPSALAVAESTDASVIFVSKDTGQITLARGGRLDPEIDSGRLLEELRIPYQSKAGGGKRKQ